MVRSLLLILGSLGPRDARIPEYFRHGVFPEPGGTVTIQVTVQSPQGPVLTYMWNVTPSDWTIASGQGTDTCDKSAASSGYLHWCAPTVVDK